MWQIRYWTECWRKQYFYRDDGVDGGTGILARHPLTKTIFTSSLTLKLEWHYIIMTHCSSYKDGWLEFYAVPANKYIMTRKYSVWVRERGTVGEVCSSKRLACHYRSRGCELVVQISSRDIDFFFSGYETFAGLATGVYSAPFIFLFPNSAKSGESSFLPN